MNIKTLTFLLIILLLFKIFLYATLIPLLLGGLCIVGILKRTNWGAMLLIIVSIVSSIFDIFSDPTYGLAGIIVALLVNVPLLIFGFLYYNAIMTNKKRKNKN